MNYYNYANFFIGLLPLAWEKVFLLFPLTIGFRYTPTRVGKRLRSVCRIECQQVYSHSRGKKHISSPDFWKYRGILPLAWEKDLVFMGKTSISSSFCHEIFYNKSHEFLHHSTLPKLSHSYIVWKKKFAQKILYKAFCNNTDKKFEKRKNSCQNCNCFLLNSL